MRIQCPSQFDHRSAVGFASQLSQFLDQSHLEIDFSNVRFVYPFPTLLIAITVREFVWERTQRSLSTLGMWRDNSRNAISYLKHIGFFQYTGLPIGNHPNQAYGGKNYLPISVISRKRVEEVAQGRSFQYGVEYESDCLAKVIFQGQYTTYPAMMLSYCFREIIRNAFEHALVDDCVVMAQRWANGFAEVAIADQGIGILTSLQTKFHVATPEEAIQTAILPGITSSSSQERDSEFENTGFGLYVVSELGKRYGNFAIVSSGRVFSLNQQNSSYRGIPVKGTIVQLRINTQDADYFPNILENIVRGGEKLAETIQGAKRTASKMSKRIPLW